MRLAKLFAPIINNQTVNYFIIDSGQHVADDDYKSYTWHRSRNNKMKAGDVFIYRKPQKISGNGQFYLYGCGQLESVNGLDAVNAPIINSHPFKRPVLQSELEDFEWKWKDRGESWEHFWNQYGINEITRDDFINLLDLLEETTYEAADDAATIESEKEIADGNYYVDDSEAVSKIRPWQGAWARKVKQNYGYQCAMCDISLPNFLVGSHIVPVMSDKDNRMNPSNGLCLCVLHDKAFDAGYITIHDDWTIHVSKQLKLDPQLAEIIESVTRSTLRKPQRYIPSLDFLQYHRSKIFRS